MLPTAVAPGLYYLADFLDREVADATGAFLDAVPRVPIELADRQREFVFTQPIFDGERLIGRFESCCGSPVWFEGIADGPPIPEPIDRVRCLVNDYLSDHLGYRVGDVEVDPVTSAYIDYYEIDGFFVPHTDRDVYGPLVAGISVGTGRGVFRFENGAGDVYEVTLEPRSLYLMVPPLRDPPWVHSFRLDSGVRYAISLRASAKTIRVQRGQGRPS